VSNELTVKNIVRLAKKHGSEPFNARDEALVAMVGLSYFSANELSLIKVSDLVTERHGLVYDAELPEEINANGKARYFFIGDQTYLKCCLEAYIKWRKENGFQVLDRELYRGLDPDSYFFLKDDGSRFDVTFKNRFEGDTVTQPLQMQRHFKKFFLGEGVTINSLMDSFIINLWNERSKAGTTQAMKDLVAITGLTAETLKKKCVRQQQSLQELLTNLYKG
jgi:hypothetical protein